MARAAPVTRAGARSRAAARRRTSVRARRGSARARATIAAYDCVEFVDDSSGRSGKYAVVETRDDGREAVVRALRRSESERHVWVESDEAEDAVVRTSALRRIESDFSQRKEDRRLDPHGERAVDAWALAEG